MDPDLPPILAARTARLVTLVEYQLIEKIVESVRSGEGSTAWDVTKLADIARLRATLERILSDNWDHVLAEAQAVLDQAAAEGQSAANIDLTRADPNSRLTPMAGNGLTMIALDTLRHLTTLPTFILRDTLDAYHAIMSAPVAELALGTATKSEAMEHALAEFTRRGIRSFRDRSGRRWTIDAYTEMAVRTGAARAQRYGYQAQLMAAGYDLVQVSGHGYSCDKCTPWEGTILSLTGQTPSGTHTMDNPLGGTATVTVAGTMEHAKQAGLFHPNCGHTFTLHIPGVSKPVTPHRDHATYEASQRQRELERRIRAEKLSLAGTGKRTNRRIRRWQSEIRALLDDYPKLARQSDREQVRRPGRAYERRRPSAPVAPDVRVYT
ncbi:phage minor capsid protein [Actinobaculum sp. 352]|uniref:phage minor capsid protein n=1 Tax=Actinobaculum sp. 352 TaxID=2490946 RepID=UPI000F7F31EE|nr:phage minor capsid protein [Actinobaculum sp. 352]RTE47899.1 hypothetical protein EKN07_11610 [Actinobaculum sp. 352]